MRNIILILLFFSVSSIFGQHFRGLKGPKAKNYKPWKDILKSRALLVTKSSKKLRSPSVKNFKPWKMEKNKNVIEVSFGSEKNKLRSPEAKNYKAWAHRKRE
jgi:hypothetical protein